MTNTDPAAAPAADIAEVKRVVLAYSGGLDTSVILRWLQEGHLHRRPGPGRGAGAGAASKAEMMGIKPEHIFIEDLREDFVRDYVFPMFRANAVYEGTYLLGTSIARPLIAKRQIEIARRDRGRRGLPRRHRQGQRPGALRARLLRAQPRHQGDRALARVGPDQPQPRLIAFAEEHQIPIAKDKRGEAPYSGRCANLLHISYEGKALEDPWVEPDDVHVHAHGPARGCPRPADLCGDRLRARRSGGGRRRAPGRRRRC